MKRSLNNAIGSQVLEFSPTMTVLFEVAQLVNSRPIRRHPTNTEEGTYLCPNDLLLGRSSPRIPQGPFNENNCLSKRYQFIQSVVESFWEKWTRDYFPTLNVLVGDMVLSKDTRAKRGVWKIGIVKDVKFSGDGSVRRAVVMYKNISESEPASQYQGTPYVEVDRPVHNLIVLDSPNDVKNDVRNKDTTRGNHIKDDKIESHDTKDDSWCWWSVLFIILKLILHITLNISANLYRYEKNI